MICNALTSKGYYWTGEHLYVSLEDIHTEFKWRITVSFGHSCYLMDWSTTDIHSMCETCANFGRTILQNFLKKLLGSTSPLPWLKRCSQRFPAQLLTYITVSNLVFNLVIKQTSSLQFHRNKDNPHILKISAYSFNKIDIQHTHEHAE